MNQWVDFRVLKQNIRIEQVLASYRVALQRVGQNQLRGACPLPTHGSERSRQSFSVDTAKNVWTCHSASCCELRQGRVGRFGMPRCACKTRDAAGETESVSASNWLQKEALAAVRIHCRH
jgi:CHC2 zinc finger